MNIDGLKVTLSDGVETELSALFPKESFVLIFLRHFGCVFCKEHVAQLKVHPSLRIAFVAMGTPQQTEEFKQKTRSPHHFIADPDRQLYQCFGLELGSNRQMFSPKTFARGFGAVLRGHLVGLPIGNPWQLPGAFLIDENGDVQWEYRSQDAADNAPVNEVIKVLS